MDAKGGGGTILAAKEALACIVYRSSPLLLLGLSIPAAGAERSVALLDGHWTYNAARSRPFEPDLRISRAGSGKFHFESASKAGYDFDLAGGSFPLPNGGTISWVPTGLHAWRVTRARKDTLLDKSTVALSGNTLRIETRAKLPNGSPYERTVTYRRQGNGDDLAGHRHCIHVDTGSTWDGFVISIAPDGVVTWRIPTDLQVIRKIQARL